MAGTVADIDNNLPDLGKYRTTEEKLSAIGDYLFLLLETLKYKLRNLTPDENFNTTEVTRWMNETVVNIGVNPELLAQIAALVEVEAPTVVTENIYATYGSVADLTVWKLRTDFERAMRYLIGDLSPLDYLSIHGEQIDFITATVSGTVPIPYAVDGVPVYWKNGPGSTMTREPTDYPVMVYPYSELVKMKIAFESIGGTKYPVISLGAGDPAGNNIARMYKSTDGLHLDYKNSEGNVDSIFHSQEENFWRINGYGIAAVDELPEEPAENVIYFTPENPAEQDLEG